MRSIEQQTRGILERATIESAQLMPTNELAEISDLVPTDTDKPVLVLNVTIPGRVRATALQPIREMLEKCGYYVAMPKSSGWVNPATDLRNPPLHVSKAVVLLTVDIE